MLEKLSRSPCLAIFAALPLLSTGLLSIFPPFRRSHSRAQQSLLISRQDRFCTVVLLYSSTVVLCATGGRSSLRDVSSISESFTVSSLQTRDTEPDTRSGRTAEQGIEQSRSIFQSVQTKIQFGFSPDNCLVLPACECCDCPGDGRWVFARCAVFRF